MVAAVHGRAHQVGEARVDEHETIVAHVFDGAHLGDEQPRLGDQEAPRLELELDWRAEMANQPLPRAVPQLEIMVDVG